MHRISWDRYFMNLAVQAAMRSTCPRKAVGAVVVRDKAVLATGYNGSIRGLPHCSDAGCLMENDHCVRTVHAEANAILQAARHGVRIEGAEIYVTASPCWSCFKLIANAGIGRILYGELYRDERIVHFAAEAGIRLDFLGVEGETWAPVRRIGVLTGGGDAPGLNAVIRAVVKASVLTHRVRVIGIMNGFSGLVELKYKELDRDEIRGLLPRGGTVLGTTNRGNPFQYIFRRPDGKDEVIDASKTVMSNVEKLGLDAVIVIGGDGSLSIGERLHREFGLPVVGVPKTIDNDISATEYTFGFATALESATSALDRLHTTAESHHRVMLLEVMGREAGWIALHAGLAGGAHMVLVPEIPFRFEPLLAKIRARERLGRPFSLIVVAEGAALKDGQQVFQSQDAITGWRRLGGVSYSIAKEIADRSGYEVRVTVLGHIQRGGSPVPTDRILATRFGVEAVRLAVEGRFGRTVALRCGEIIDVPLTEAIGHLKRVDPHEQLMQDARSVGIVFGDEEPEDVEAAEG